MKRIFNIFITCALLVSLLGGAGFLTTSCTPEDQPGTDQPSGGEGEGDKEEPSVPGAPAAFSKFIPTHNKGKLYLKSGQTSCTLGGVSGVSSGAQKITGCESYGAVVSDVKLAGAQGGSASGIGGIVGASYNQATMTVNGCTAACDITAPAGSTAFMLVGVVGSNKAVTTANVIGTEESPNVISGGSITLGTEKVAMTSENFLTKALPWGTGKPANANIKYKVIWK